MRHLDVFQINQNYLNLKKEIKFCFIMKFILRVTSPATIKLSLLVNKMSRLIIHNAMISAPVIVSGSSMPARNKLITGASLAYVFGSISNTLKKFNNSNNHKFLTINRTYPSLSRRKVFSCNGSRFSIISGIDVRMV
jgi:hypothetical protein